MQYQLSEIAHGDSQAAHGTGRVGLWQIHGEIAGGKFAQGFFELFRPTSEHGLGHLLSKPDQQGDANCRRHHQPDKQVMGLGKRL